MSLLTRRYASALFQTARDKGALEQVAADVAALHAVLAAPGARALLTSPDVTAAERQRVLDRLGEGRHQLVRGLLQVAQQRHRLEILPELHPEFRALVMAHRQEVEGVVETAQPLAAEQLEQVTALAGRLSGRKVSLSTQIKPELIGGIRLRLGHELYDGSVRTALDQLEQRLLQAPV